MRPDLPSRHAELRHDRTRVHHARRPDMADTMKDADYKQRQARDEGRGLWGACAAAASADSRSPFITLGEGAH